MNCSHCCAETKRLSITAASGATDWASKLQRGLQIVVTEEDPSQVSSSDSESYQKRSLKTEPCCKEHACARFGTQVLSISQGGKSPGMVMKAYSAFIFVAIISLIAALVWAQQA